jgi:hypothetical protein
VTDKARDCVSSLIAIAHGEGSLQQKLGNAERQIAGLLADAHVQVGESFTVLQHLRDRLGIEINTHHGLTREFLDKVLDFVDYRLGRTPAS